MKISILNKKPLPKNTALVRISKDISVSHLEKDNGQTILLIKSQKEMNLRKFILLVRSIVAYARQYKLKDIGLDFFQLDFKLDDYSKARIIAENLIMANFEFIEYKTDKKDISFVNDVYILGDISKEAQKGFNDGTLIGQSVNDARVLANTNGGAMTPEILADYAKKISSRNKKIKTTVLEKKDMQKLGMGGILGVAQGSNQDPKFIIMEFLNGKPKDAPIVLIGKGITFDSGGINIKPADACSDMYMDMAGGAAVMEAVEAAGLLDIKKNIIGIVPAAENMPSGTSYRPGDVLKMMSGATVEVNNTDAEGRILLADALTYCHKYNPKVVIDVATLTGAALSALGQRASAIFANNSKLIETLQDLGEKTGDYVWPLPLWEEYEEELKGDFADYSNVQKTRYGGAIIGATFLHFFAKKLNWGHIDIAPRMSSVEGEFLAKGATGVPVRLLVKFLEEYN